MSRASRWLLSVYYDKSKLRPELGFDIERGEYGPWLVGPNWIIDLPTTDEADELAKKLG